MGGSGNGNNSTCNQVKEGIHVCHTHTCTCTCTSATTKGMGGNGSGNGNNSTCVGRQQSQSQETNYSHKSERRKKSHHKKKKPFDIQTHQKSSINLRMDFFKRRNGVVREAHGHVVSVGVSVSVVEPVDHVPHVNHVPHVPVDEYEFPALISTPLTLPRNQESTSNNLRPFLAVVNKSILEEATTLVDCDSDELHCVDDPIKAHAQKHGWFSSSSLPLGSSRETSEVHVVSDPIATEAVIQHNTDFSCELSVQNNDGNSTPLTQHFVNHSNLFQCSISDKIREKYRKRWLDIAHEATVREAQRSKDAAKKAADDKKAMAVSWHSALSPVVVVSNKQLDEVHAEKIASKLTPVSDTYIESNSRDTVSVLMGDHVTGESEELWWSGIFSGDVKLLEKMMRSGFEWSSLTLGEIFG